MKQWVSLLSPNSQQYGPLNPCLICILVDSPEEVQRRAFAATALTAEEHRKCHKISNL
jgi:hypothetical protein